MTPKKKKYHLTEKQCANVILAARDKSGCPAAIGFVKKLDKKFKLKKKKY